MKPEDVKVAIDKARAKDPDKREYWDNLGLTETFIKQSTGSFLLKTLDNFYKTDREAIAASISLINEVYKAAADEIMMTSFGRKCERQGKESQIRKLYDGLSKANCVEGLRVMKDMIDNIDNPGQVVDRKRIKKTHKNSNDVPRLLGELIKINSKGNTGLKWDVDPNDKIKEGDFNIEASKDSQAQGITLSVARAQEGGSDHDLVSRSLNIDRERTARVKVVTFNGGEHRLDKAGLDPEGVKHALQYGPRSVPDVIFLNFQEMKGRTKSGAKKEIRTLLKDAGVADPDTWRVEIETQRQITKKSVANVTTGAFWTAAVISPGITEDRENIEYEQLSGGKLAWSSSPLGKKYSITRMTGLHDSQDHEEVVINAHLDAKKEMYRIASVYDLMRDAATQGGDDGNSKKRRITLAGDLNTREYQDGSDTVLDSALDDIFGEKIKKVSTARTKAKKGFQPGHQLDHIMTKEVDTSRPMSSLVFGMGADTAQKNPGKMEELAKMVYDLQKERHLLMSFKKLDDKESAAIDLRLQILDNEVGESKVSEMKGLLDPATDQSTIDGIIDKCKALVAEKNETIAKYFPKAKAEAKADKVRQSSSPHGFFSNARQTLGGPKKTVNNQSKADLGKRDTSSAPRP